MDSRAPLNLLVSWTWPILFIAMLAYAFGSTARSAAAQNVLLSATYTLGGATLSSNICAFIQELRRADLFSPCDVIGIAVGGAVEGSFIRYKFTEREWDFISKALSSTTGAIMQMVLQTVATVEVLTSVMVREMASGWPHWPAVVLVLSAVSFLGVRALRTSTVRPQ